MNKNLRTFLVIAGIVAGTGIVLLILPRRKGSVLTDEQFARLLNSTKSSWLHNALWGARTRQEISALHPAYRSIVKDFFDEVEEKTPYIPIITSAYRSFDKQSQLHALDSRNAPAGYSSHNYGFAVDINLLDKNTGKVSIHKNSPSEAWKKSGILDIAKKRGILWGGTFSGYYDPVHFYIEPKGMKSSDLYAMVKAGKTDKGGYVIV